MDSSSPAKQSRHSFARELFRFNNTQSASAAASGSASAAGNAAILRTGSADGGPTAYGTIRHRTGNRAAIPMRKAKTQQSYTASSASSPPAGTADSGKASESKRTNRLSALLSPSLWSASGRASAGSKDSAKQHHSKSDSVPPPRTASHASPPHVAPIEAPPTIVAMNGSDAVELPPGTRVGKTARANMKHHLQTHRVPHSAPLPSSSEGSRRSSLPSSATIPPASSASQSFATPPYPLPLPPGQKARTVIIGISPPPTAPHDGSLATFEHVRRHVLRQGEEAILHTVLPESQARRQVTSPQDLIELTAELEREDAQFLEMQSACMNFLTLLAVELETSQRFVKIHVTQAQPPDGGTAAQARAHSRSTSRSHSRANSRPSSSAGLGGLFGFGSGADADERGRSRTCERLKAREDEAIANELGRVAREHNADLIVIGQPASAEDGEAPQPQSSRSHSRAHSRTHSRATSRNRNAVNVEDAAMPSLFNPSRRGSRASKGSGSGAAGGGGGLLSRRGSGPDIISKLQSLQLGAGRTADHDSTADSKEGGLAGVDPMQSPPQTGLSADWNFGADSLSAVSPFPAANHHDLDSHDVKEVLESPRTGQAPLAPDDPEHVEPHHVNLTPVGQVLLVNAGGVTHGPLSSTLSEYATAHAAQPKTTTSTVHEPHSAPTTQLTHPILGEGAQVTRRGSHITIADEPADSPLRRRDRARQQPQPQPNQRAGPTGVAAPEGESDAPQEGGHLASESQAGSSSLPSTRRGSLANARRMSNGGGGGGGGTDGGEAGSGLTPAAEAPGAGLGGADGSGLMGRLRSASGSASGSAGQSAGGLSRSAGVGSSQGAAGGPGSGGGGAAKRLSRLLEKAHHFSPNPFASSSSTAASSGARRPLNGLATTLVRNSPVPVLVVDRDVLDTYR